MICLILYHYLLFMLEPQLSFFSPTESKCLYSFKCCTDEPQRWTGLGTLGLTLQENESPPTSFCVYPGEEQTSPTLGPSFIKKTNKQMNKKPKVKQMVYCFQKIRVHGTPGWVYLPVFFFFFFLNQDKWLLHWG